MVSDINVISVDGGGSQTTILLANLNSKLAYVKRTKGTSPNLYGEVGINRLKKNIISTIDYSRLSKNDISSLVVGMAGISTPKYKPKLKKILSDLVPLASIYLVSDAEMAHRAIWGKAHGMTLLVGTGSIAIGEDSNGLLKRSGGYGFQIGDVGSGYWLGKNLLTQLIISERSEVKDLVDLRKVVIDHYKTKLFEEALEIASSDKNIAEMAGLAVPLLHKAEDGNYLAKHIVDSGVEGLEELICNLIPKLDNQKSIGFHGSLITKSKFYRSLLLNRLGIENWEKTQNEAVFGGLILIEEEIKFKELTEFQVKYG